MIEWLKSLLTKNWRQKAVALFAALIMWLFLDSSLTGTKTLARVPIHVINMPEGKTIVGLSPNGFLQKRVHLTLTGSRKTIDSLEPGDIELAIDASKFDGDEQVIHLNRKNLINHNPNIDILAGITEIHHPDFSLRLSDLVTEKIPIKILPPKGSPPPGYIFLDIWPQKLTQTITGPEEQVEVLKNHGFELTFDLSHIQKSELDHIKGSRENYHDDDVSFFIPASWKKIPISFRNNTLEEINDPDSQNLHIDFLRKELLPLERSVSVRLFYPTLSLDIFNPTSLKIDPLSSLSFKNKVAFISSPLYAKNVSRLFLEVIRDNIVISLVPSKDEAHLAWGVNIIAPEMLEEKYVSYLISHHFHGSNTEPRHSSKRQSHLRSRFRQFLDNMTLYDVEGKRLEVEAINHEGKVVVTTSTVDEEESP